MSPKHLQRFPCHICHTLDCHHHRATQLLLNLLPDVHGFGVSTSEIWLPLLYASACMYVSQHQRDPMHPLVVHFDALETLASAFGQSPIDITMSVQGIVERILGDATFVGDEEKTLPGAEPS